MGIVLTRVEMVKGLEPLASFSVDDARRLFQKYEEVCPTPALWEHAFGELFLCISGRESVHKAFTVLDTDGNGLVDGIEVFAGLALLSQGHLADRLSLLFDMFDLNKEEMLHFDDVFLLLRRSMVGLRKMTGLITPPDKVIMNMAKHIFKNATKHKNASIVKQDWYNWWSTDATIRSALKMVTWRQEDQRGLPTPDQQVNVDYTRGAVDDDAIADVAGGVGSAGLRASLLHDQRIRADRFSDPPDPVGCIALDVGAAL